MNNLKICMESQKILNSQSDIEKQKLKVSYSLISNYTNQNIIVLAKKRHKDQWTITERPEINQHIYKQLIYDKEGQNIQWGKDNLFNRWCWENWADTWKKIKNKTGPLSYTIYKNKVKMDSRLECKT